MIICIFERVQWRCTLNGSTARATWLGPIIGRLSDLHGRLSLRVVQPFVRNPV